MVHTIAPLLLLEPVHRQQATGGDILNTMAREGTFFIAHCGAAKDALENVYSSVDIERGRNFVR
jgi:hypothetical protein